MVTGLIGTILLGQKNPFMMIVNSCDRFIFFTENLLFSTPIYKLKERLGQNTNSNESQLEAENQELRKENDELRKQLGLNQSLSEVEIINANVIARPLDLYCDEITIDVGKKDGIDQEYAVITSEGLIGRISQINTSSSQVLLFTTETEENKCAVRILIDDESDCDAIFENYNSNTGYYQIKLLNTSKSIEKGMKVVTTGMGGVFPSGLLIGFIESIDESQSSLGVCYNVLPSVDFSAIRVVSVVKRIGTYENGD